MRWENYNLVDCFCSEINNDWFVTWRAAFSADDVFSCILLLVVVCCRLIDVLITDPGVHSLLASEASEQLTVVTFWGNIWFTPGGCEKGVLTTGELANRFSVDELDVVPDMMDAVLAMAARAIAGWLWAAAR